MKHYFKLTIGVLFLLMALSSCENSVDQEAPDTDNTITDFYYTYFYPDTTYAYKGTENEIMSISIQSCILGHTLRTSNDTIYVTPSIPGSGIPKGRLSEIKLTQLWATATIAGTASVKPLDGAPLLGTKGNFSQPVTYQVKAADGTTKNWVIVTAALPVLNGFDGYYTLSGSMTDNMSTTLTCTYPLNIALVTYPASSPNSIALVDQNNTMGYNSGNYHLLDGSFYGEFDPVFTIDSSNKVTSVVNLYGQPSPTRARSAELDATGVNTWNPDTKILKVKYWLVQSGVRRTLFDETYTFAGPR